MKESTTKYIQSLTEADTKTLSQKGLKVAEEAGELASAILPYDNAAGTIHRFIAKEHILEEIADVYLTSISIAYDLGFTDEEFEAMVERKMEKWAKLQKGEGKLKFPLPYEIHITISLEDDHRIEVELEAFRAACKEVDVKPIILDLQMKNGTATDYMTSSKHYGSNATAYEEMKRISTWLTSRSFNVVREKIETVPWHPAAPTKNFPDMPEGCYFESHISTIISTDDEKKRLRWLIENFNDAIAHDVNAVRLSRNPFKVLEDGNYVQMMTFRRYNGTYEDFKKKNAMLRAETKRRGFTIKDVVTEFSIYDTMVSHDDSWIKDNVGN